MAYYDEDFQAPPRERRTRRSPAPYYAQPDRSSHGAGWALVILVVFALLLLGLLAHAFGVSVPLPSIRALPTAELKLPPTSAPNVRQQDAESAPATAAEQQAHPAPQPAPAPASAEPQPAPAFSPTDLGDVPVQPASSLPLEQQQAAAESAEQNYLDSVNSTLTGAQRQVAEHEACWNAGGCGVTK